MIDSLDRLAKMAQAHPYWENNESLPACLRLYRCYKKQELRALPFYNPVVLLVLEGHKEIRIAEQQLQAQPGELLLIPGETTLWMGNCPDEKQYLGLAFNFNDKALEHFRLLYGGEQELWDLSAKWHASAPDEVLVVLQQWLSMERGFVGNAQLTQHKQVELLLLLAQAGLAGNILMGQHPSWRQRVLKLFVLNPARDWLLADVCKELVVSEATLRRRLKEEQTGFRELLEETRLLCGLSLLLETMWPISRVADAVGYHSQSRFGERFKRRFGMTPTELRATRIEGRGEKLLVSSE